jgi:Baseplate J-like protein
VIYNCCNENRKAAVHKNPNLNGIDYLDVLDHDAIALGIPRQTTLLIHCLKQVPSTLTPDNVIISGGESVTKISVDWITPAYAPSPKDLNAEERQYLTSLSDAANILVVRTDVAGDFSTYSLRLVNQVSNAAADPFELTEVLAGFDLQLAEIQFSFKVECNPNFDCAPRLPDCPPDLPVPPPINYLAKDYGSFRTIILDRLNQLLPSWGASSEADLGIVLAELIAYTGDHLSYQQDAIATEAYLETARSRVSLRRHALLVDYHVHDGCNARAWIQVQIKAGSPLLLDRTKTRFYAFAPGRPSTLAVGSRNEAAAILSGVQAFEPMWDAILYPEHNRMSFYTWGDSNCCLPKGATEATLRGSYANLHPGDVLVFQEVVGPQTGEQADADIRHRCAVRLTRVATADGQMKPLQDSLFDSSHPVPLTEIQWSQQDALPFPLCISSTYLDSNGDEQFITDVSIALGNVVLADHGLSFPSQSLGTVPGPELYMPPDPAVDRCKVTLPKPLPVRYRPTVPYKPLTQAVPLGTIPLAAVSPPAASNVLPLTVSAYELTNFDPSQAVPSITLVGTLNAKEETWISVQDLLGSGNSDPVFVVEMESDSTASLRFATPPDPRSILETTNGMVPDSGTNFVAHFRIGNGTAGNVGTDSLTHFDGLEPSRVISCTNPLPATGGVDPETDDQIRRRAPQAFVTQERAVTMADYESKVEINPMVDRAVASLRWTGSWYTVFIAVEPKGAGNLSPGLQKTLKQNLERYRFAGQDLELDSPQYVSLEIELQVCVDPNYFASDVEQALLQVLGNQLPPNGRKGVFYPDNFTFGQTVYLSPVYVAARSVAGVVSVVATKFQPQGVDTPQYLAAGEIKLGSLQVARLDNDPSYPDHGQLSLIMQGGK